METLVTNKVSLVLSPKKDLVQMDQQTRIVNKAHELFLRYGIRSVSMDEVATQLGMSKKTIYQFYADKDGLVSDVIDIEIEKSQSCCTDQHKKSENAIHEIFMAVDMLHDTLHKMNPAVIFDMEKYHPKAFLKYTTYKNKFLFSIIRDNMERGKKEDLYRTEIDAEVMARFRLASVFLVLNPELFPLGKNMSLSSVITEITDNFLYGLATSKGQKMIQKYKQQRQKSITYANT